MLINRPIYMSKIAGFIGKPVVKVLTGMRRCGKSSLLSLVKDRLSADSGVAPIYLNFDLFENTPLRDPLALHSHIIAHAPQRDTFAVLLDEIQEVVGWEKVVNSLVAEGRADVYITGSNSNLLSSDLATYIAGRYVNLEVATLSFSEYVHFAHETGRSESTDQLFNRFLVEGGFPSLFAAEYTTEQVRQLVSDIYASSLMRDVLTRHQIRSTELFERVATYAMDNIGNTFSARRIAAFLKSESKAVSHQTVADYLNALCEAFVLHKVTRYDLRGRSHLATQEKYYAGDHGLSTALLGYSVTRLPGLLENIVQAELRLRGYEVHVGRLDQAEVDFIGQRQSERVYVQVCTTILDPTTAQREYAPLLSINDSYPKYVVTMDTLAGGSLEGVQHRRLPEFLLDQSW